MANISEESLVIRSNITNQTSSDVHEAVYVNQIVWDLYNVYLYFVMILGLPGNTLVLVVLSKHKPTTTTDWYILFITVCDFVTLFINVPVYITISHGVWYMYGNNTICSLHTFLSQSVILSSSFLICGLALDRYVRICRPMASYSAQRARNVCILITISTTVLLTPCTVMFESRQGSCLPKVGLVLFVYYLFLFLTFTVATIVVIISYIQINRRIKQTESSITMHYLSRRSPRALENVRIASTRKINQINPYLNHCGNDMVLRKHNDKIRNTVVMVGAAHSAAGLSNSKDCKGKTVEVSTVSGKNVLSPRNPKSSSPKVDSQTRMNNYRQASLLATKISFMVCAIFIISWIPPWANFFVVITGNDSSFPVALLAFTQKTHLLNAMTNPILYALLNRKFRKLMLDIMCCRRI